jgi:hypothetical protein
MATAMRVLEWCAWFEGRMRLDGTVKSAVNASRGIGVAETWPLSLELAANLLFRQNRTEKIEIHTLQPALKGLPTTEMQTAAMEQLATIMRNPQFQKREWFAPKGRTYFLVN